MSRLPSLLINKLDKRALKFFDWVEICLLLEAAVDSLPCYQTAEEGHSTCRHAIFHHFTQPKYFFPCLLLNFSVASACPKKDGLSIYARRIISEEKRAALVWVMRANSSYSAVRLKGTPFCRLKLTRFQGWRSCFGKVTLLLLFCTKDTLTNSKVHIFPQVSFS